MLKGRCLHREVLACCYAPFVSNKNLNVCSVVGELPAAELSSTNSRVSWIAFGVFLSGMQTNTSVKWSCIGVNAFAINVLLIFSLNVFVINERLCLHSQSWKKTGLKQHTHHSEKGLHMRIIVRIKSTETLFDSYPSWRHSIDASLKKKGNPFLSLA